MNLRMARPFAVALASAALLAACATPSEAPAPDATVRAASPTPASSPRDATALLETHGIAGDARDVVDTLDRVPLEDRDRTLMVSVRRDEILVSDETTTEPLSLPLDGGFYVSIAPYYDATHECFYHSLTTCAGELGGEDVRVTVTSAEGDVLADHELTTYDNGFVGLWLPRDIEGTVRVEHEGASVESAIATGPEDPTCITTMRLAG